MHAIANLFRKFIYFISGLFNKLIFHFWFIALYIVGEQGVGDVNTAFEQFRNDFSHSYELIFLLKKNVTTEKYITIILSSPIDL
jgi:hypothetical protein